jgi:hypothetical protein
LSGDRIKRADGKKHKSAEHLRDLCSDGMGRYSNRTYKQKIATSVDKQASMQRKKISK